MVLKGDREREWENRWDRRGKHYKEISTFRPSDYNNMFVILYKTTLTFYKSKHCNEYVEKHNMKTKSNPKVYAFEKNRFKQGFSIICFLCLYYKLLPTL